MTNEQLKFKPAHARVVGGVIGKAAFISHKGVKIGFESGRCKMIQVLDDKPRARHFDDWQRRVSTWLINPQDIFNGVCVGCDTVERAWIIWLVHRHFDLPFSLIERSSDDRRRWYQLRYGEVMDWLRDKPTITYLGKKA